MNTTQQTQHQYHRTQLFLARLWSDEVEASHAGDEAPQKATCCKGRVQHVVSGEAHSFDNWPTLVALLIQMLPAAATEQTRHAGGGTSDEP